MGPSLKITNESQGKRLDVVLARAYPQYSRAYLQKIVRAGAVTLKGQVPQPNYLVTAGEEFLVRDFSSPVLPSSPAGTGRGSTSIDSPPKTAGNDVTVLFEDDFLLAINKPAGWVVHPAPGHRSGTLLDWLKEYLGSAATTFPD